ncbi:MAG: hypothetical protein ACI85K_000434 [Hyphomicrobiaceae bacterium]|jgi:hypothetical protein
MPQPCWSEASITAQKLAGLLLGLDAVVCGLPLVLAGGFDSLVSGLRRDGGDDFGGARSRLADRSPKVRFAGMLGGKAS